MATTGAVPETLTLAPSQLPIAQLESLRSKVNQMIESLILLQRTIEAGGQNLMPAWPDILSKYTILLSQSHTLCLSLVGTYAQPTPPSSTSNRTNQQPQNPFERIALHPIGSMPDTQFDTDVVPLIRVLQTTDVLRAENDTVRHLAEHMDTRGTLGVLAPQPPPAMMQYGMGIGMRRDVPRKPEYEDVLRECDQIRMEHDERVERASKVVQMLIPKYDWKGRVTLAKEQAEELLYEEIPEDTEDMGGENEGMNVDADGGVDNAQNGSSQDDERSNSSEEEEELEEVLGNGSDHSPPGTPLAQTVVAGDAPASTTSPGATQ